MLQFLCLQVCVYGGGAVPQGGPGDRHLVTVPQGVVGDRLPWGGEGQGGGEYAKPCRAQRAREQRGARAGMHNPMAPGEARDDGQKAMTAVGHAAARA